MVPNYLVLITARCVPYQVPGIGQTAEDVLAGVTGKCLFFFTRYLECLRAPNFVKKVDGRR